MLDGHYYILLKGNIGVIYAENRHLNKFKNTIK